MTNHLGQSESKNKSMALALSASGLTVYMTRDAIRFLAGKLLEISDAEPSECYEVHLRKHFSTWNSDDQLVVPNLSFSDGLADVLTRIGREQLEAEIARGEIVSDAQLAPFELTIMHVSAEAVLEEAARPDE
jgi:hypothetical protein